jgi:ubiquitin-protein ligase
MAQAEDDHIPKTTRKRIEKELSDWEEPLPGWTLRLKSESNLLRMEATMQGPANTPFEGGIFHFEITLHPDYPFKPPRVNITTKVFHPNWWRGAHCFTSLHEDWSPATTLKKGLQSIQSAFECPNFDDPMDVEAAMLVKSDIDEYNKKAAQYTKKYATSSQVESD